METINYFDVERDFFDNPDIVAILEKYNFSVYHPDDCVFNTDQWYIVAQCWGDIERAEKEIIALGLIDDIPDLPRHGELLEKGFDLVFSDEYTSCSCCGKLLKTTPSCYGDLPEYIINDGEILCSDCYGDDDIIDLALNDTDTAVNIRQLKKSLESHGFKLFRENLESGFHPGQTDDPQDISKEIEQLHPAADWLFCIDGAGQFDISFSAWYKERDDD
jgi:hypothetical protein